ncbi:MAG: hypothetical protein LBO82_04750 [Synergistaceae bacterium]|jgi:hypothetical protein|nr:hypothetical protein [Synergistaceae bacterium]
MAKPPLDLQAHIPLILLCWVEFAFAIKNIITDEQHFMFKHLKYCPNVLIIRELSPKHETRGGFERFRTNQAKRQKGRK